MHTMLTDMCIYIYIRVVVSYHYLFTFNLSLLWFIVPEAHALFVLNHRLHIYMNNVMTIYRYVIT